LRKSEKYRPKQPLFLAEVSVLLGWHSDTHA